MTTEPTYPDILKSIRRNANRARDALRARDELITLARYQGHTLKAIAQAAGLTDAGILGITRRTPKP